MITFAKIQLMICILITIVKLERQEMFKSDKKSRATPPQKHSNKRFKVQAWMIFKTCHQDAAQAAKTQNSFLKRPL